MLMTAGLPSFFGFIHHVLNRGSVEDLVHGIVHPLPEGAGATNGLVGTGHGMYTETWYGGCASLEETDDFPCGDVTGFYDHAVASLGPPLASDISCLVEDGDDLLEVFRGEVLPRGYVFDLNVVFPFVDCHIDQQTQGISALRGHLHYFTSRLAIFPICILV